MPEKNLPWRGWALVLLVFLIPFQRSYVHLFPKDVLSHAGCPYNWIKYTLFDLFFFFLLARLLLGFKNVIKKKEALALFAFLALCLLSLLFHPYATYLLPSWHLLKLFGASLLFLALLAESQNRHAPLLLRSLLTSLTFSSAVESLLAILQFFKQKSLGLKALGEGVLDAARRQGPVFEMEGGSRWLLDHLFNIKRNAAFLLRASGTFDHPNQLGLFLVAGLIALICLYLKGSRKERFVLSLLFCLIFFALCLTFSRASLFTFLISLAVMIPALGRQALPLFRLIAPVILLCSLLLFPQILKRGGVLNSTLINRAADRERVLYQNHSFALIKRHPFQGVGFRNYVERLNAVSATPLEDSRPLLVHNIFLLVGSEEGLLGLFFFLALWMLVLKRAWIARRDPTAAVLGSLLLALIFYGCCDHFLLSEQQGLLLLFFILGGAALSSGAALEHTPTHPCTV